MIETPTIDRETITAEVLKKYREWGEMRRPHESTWFVTAAMLRGQQHVEYDTTQGLLVTPERPSYAVTLDLNKMRPKHRARMAKFLKKRPKPIVIPASTDYEDLMDARASERAIRYQADRLGLERKYRDVRLWASVCFKGYWWLGYDDSAMGRVQQKDPTTGKTFTQSAQLGDATLEVGNAWEVLIPDPTLQHVGQQPEILRVRRLKKVEAQRRFPDHAEAMVPGTEGASQDTEQRLSTLRAGGTSGATTGGAKRENDMLLLEWFEAPCRAYPKGRKATLCGNQLVRYEEELPFELYDNATNPYPCVEFSDGDSPGQFYGTTWLEQLTPIQRGINRLIELAVENGEAVSRPKIIVYKQHNLPDGAWVAAAGEIVELNWIPGLPEPRIIQPASVGGDIWNLINLFIRQMDDVSQIHTASEGGGSGQESGYQTSLLQEATDAVHAPDIRADELAIEEWAWKVRRIMKLTWDVPRLLTITDEYGSTEMQEFSQRQINDHAEVRIQIGSMLPDLKAAKAQAVLEYYKAGVFGDPADPMVRRKALSMIDVTGTDLIHPEDQLDDAEARREEQALMTGDGVEPAKWFHAHATHAASHEAKMKTPEWASLPPPVKLAYLAHLITHIDFLNLPLAMGLRTQFGLVNLPIATPPPQAPPAPAPSGPPASPSPQPQAPPPASSAPPA